MDFFIRLEVVIDKIDISIKFKLGDKFSFSIDLYEKCNGLYNGSGSFIRINGEVFFFGVSMEVLLNIVLKLKIRKIILK